MAFLIHLAAAADVVRQDLEHQLFHKSQHYGKGSQACDGHCNREYLLGNALGDLWVFAKPCDENLRIQQILTPAHRVGAPKHP